MTFTTAISAPSSPRQRSLFETEVQTRSKPRLDNGIERRFDVPFVARLALKEKQLQQNVRPIIAVHKWFARRPGTLFRALLLSEFADNPLVESYYLPHRFDDLRIADPFMGGGTPLFEANRLGCDVAGWDVNPMAYWIVGQELTHLDVEAYLAAAREVEGALAEEVGSFYRTRCTSCGDPDAQVKYFIWVKRWSCPGCAEEMDLFPGYLLAANRRHPIHVVICSECGDLNEVDDLEAPGKCAGCATPLVLEGPARRSRFQCRKCGEEHRYPDPGQGPPRHRMVALEYHCARCKPRHRGRFFKKPDREDHARFDKAEDAAGGVDPRWIPDDPIPAGDETARLHRWGYQLYRELFNPRQLLGLAKLAERIDGIEDERIRWALATNLSDLLRYQNMLCRYDTRALKSLDVFSVHGFPIGLVQCESNLLGIRHPKGEGNVGSGGWSNIVEKFARAKRFCDRPFEIRYDNRGRQVVPVDGEWIGDRRNGRGTEERSVKLHCGSAAEADLPPASLDAVLTDPPYFANVQYAELMDFCYVWLRRLAGGKEPAFSAATAHRTGDLTGNQTHSRGLEHFAEGLSRVYRRMARSLKPGRPFAFTYHHNALEAYHPVAVALLDAGLVCSASLPCPAEMGGSIHIHKSESSIVDTVFVCRSTGRIPLYLLVEDPAEIAELVAFDLDQLRRAEVTVTRGDARCITYGHLVRLAVWQLRDLWDASEGWEDKLSAVGQTLSELADWETILEHLEASSALATRRGDELREPPARPYADEVEF